MPNEETLAFHYAVYEQVQQIPPGKVTTYGHIAKLIYRPMNSRQVGQSLKYLPIYGASTTAEEHDSDEDGGGNREQNPFHTDNVPWWRVINAQGKISPRGNHFAEDRQAECLRNENVEVIDKKVDLFTYGWFPPTDFDL